MLVNLLIHVDVVSMSHSTTYRVRLSRLCVTILQESDKTLKYTSLCNFLAVFVSCFNRPFCADNSSFNNYNNHRILKANSYKNVKKEQFRRQLKCKIVHLFGKDAVETYYNAFYKTVQDANTK